MINKGASASSLVSQNKPAERKTPVDQYNVRHASVKNQKRQMLLAKLAQFPNGFLMFHCFVLAIFAAIYIATQIAIMVKRTPLFYVCTGFWMGLVYFACIYTVFVLAKNQTYNALIKAMIMQGIGLVLTLGGPILLNCADAALFVQNCIPKCLNEFSYQFLNILMVISGIVAFCEFCLFFLLIECLVFREARSLNMYLQNRK